MCRTVERIESVKSIAPCMQRVVEWDGTLQRQTTNKQTHKTSAFARLTLGDDAQHGGHGHAAVLELRRAVLHQALLVLGEAQGVPHAARLRVGAGRALGSVRALGAGWG